MSEVTRQYPAECEQCKEEKGFPYQVRTLNDRPGQIEIKLRCRGCGHEWSQVISSND